MVANRRWPMILNVGGKITQKPETKCETRILFGGVRLEPCVSLGGRQRLFFAWPKQSVKGAEMDEEASMPGLEVWYPEEEILLLGDRGRVGFIDGIHFRIARPGIEVPVNADCKVWHHWQWPMPVWWQNRHVKTANDGHEIADRAIRSYQIIQ